jgi:hypothetical protein
VTVERFGKSPYRGEVKLSGLANRSSRATYRLRQFWLGLRAEVTAAELAEAAATLPPTATLLFRRLPADAQRHSLNVLAGVRAQGATPADLEAAALLHDAGKLAAEQAGVRIGLWLRGPLVLLGAFAPGLPERLARDDPRAGWRYALHVHLQHPRIGAQWAAAAGCTPGACWLIAHHQDAEPPPGADEETVRQLRRLQRADNEN